MTDTPTPTAGAMRAASKVAHTTLTMPDGKVYSATQELIAFYIDRETKLPELLMAAKLLCDASRRGIVLYPDVERLQVAIAKSEFGRPITAADPA